MRLVRDMGKDSNKEFKQHQRSRLFRFDKLIMTYLANKQDEVLENWSSNHAEIEAILTLLNMFDATQLRSFLVEKFIKDRLVNEFKDQLNQVKDGQLVGMPKEVLESSGKRFLAKFWLTLKQFASNLLEFTKAAFIGSTLTAIAHDTFWPAAF